MSRIDAPQLSGQECLGYGARNGARTRIDICSKFKAATSTASRPKRTWSAASLMIATRSSETADVMNARAHHFVTRDNNRGDMEVPELTPNAGVNLKRATFVAVPVRKSIVDKAAPD
jgi:hypothetical protein